MASSDKWRKLLEWYATNGRSHLPWRGHVSDYRVAVSEFMLQQTQVDRVVPLYKKFIGHFPTWKTLAASKQSNVVRAWKGLGYNMRAVRLRDLARTVVEKYASHLPADESSLLQLKGIGPYTSRALRVFVHRENLFAPDTNIRRVLTRVFKGPETDPRVLDWSMWQRWEVSIPHNAGYDLNQALMDLGSAVCRAGTPHCEICPLKKFCASYPKILTLDRKKLPRQKIAAKERLDQFGIPNRIYRGRIIERLRKSGVHEKDLGPLGRSIRERFTKKDLVWLHKILDGLKRDGLIETHNRVVRLR